MLGTLTLFLAVAATDPRPALVELQIEGRPRSALDVVEQESRERPDVSRRLGLDYLRGHLLELLGDPRAAGEAFAEALALPELQFYSRYRMALEQERQRHPEVAAGLIATAVAQAPPASPLLPEAVQLLARTLEKGGDCRLLRPLKPDTMPERERRLLLLSQADCALRSELRELARSILTGLLEENVRDDTARGAAERLAGIVSEAEAGRLPMLLGTAFYRHHDLDRALQYLRRAVGKRGLSQRDGFEALALVGGAQLLQGRAEQAAATFGSLAVRARTPEQRARALYQQGRAHELQGRWQKAVESFAAAHQASPTSAEWAPAALFASLRLDWRRGREAAALSTYEVLAARREWRPTIVRASLFLAASDLVRGRSDRAGGWLARAAGDRGSRIESAYWRGRLAELQGDEVAAVAAYLEVLRADALHPLAQGAQRRLAAAPLGRTTAAEGRRRGNLSGVDNARDAWLLLGDSDPMGRRAGFRLRQLLLADTRTAPFLRMAVVPVDQWPLWESDLRRPEEMLLALGLWHEGGPAVAAHFPLRAPSLAFTASRRLAAAGELSRAIQLADDLRRRTPERVLLRVQPRDFRQTLHPAAYRELLMTQGRTRGVDPDLLAAIIRNESRFDPLSLTPAGERGLTHLTPARARALARQAGLGSFAPEDLYRPEVAVALGAIHLADLERTFGGATHVAVAAYDAGESQAIVWRSYCNSLEPEEFFTKVTSDETRRYLHHVLAGWAEYQALY